MKKERLYYLDWLRLSAFGLLILFHCLRFFDFFPWHVKNEEQSEFLTQIFLFTTSWRMPLIFFVSGAGTYFAMKSRKEAFMKDRYKRLIIPFIFGVLLLIPPQKYFEYLFYGGELMSYGSFLTIYPSRLLESLGTFNLGWIGLMGYHIWYLPYLFVQTLIMLPIFKYFQKRESSLQFSQTGLWALFPIIVIIN
ncbi:MAG: acyltransferase family protein, partial [Bacteroidota bacterium]